MDGGTYGLLRHEKGECKKGIRGADQGPIENAGDADFEWWMGVGKGLMDARNKVVQPVSVCVGVDADAVRGGISYSYVETEDACREPVESMR